MKVSKMTTSFKKFNEFIGESLVILSMKGLMTNEFKNNIELNLDYETARRMMYERTSSIFNHKGGDEFHARTLVKLEDEDIDKALTDVNDQMSRMKFIRSGKPKKSIINEWIWTIKCSLD
jgi:hypothetical protein